MSAFSTATLAAKYMPMPEESSKDGATVKLKNSNSSGSGNGTNVNL